VSWARLVQRGLPDAPAGRLARRAQERDGPRQDDRSRAASPLPSFPRPATRRRS